ncbi:MAG: hypothetical protein U0Y10_25620 [Spirosomataceae bacterium]
MKTTLLSLPKSFRLLCAIAVLAMVGACKKDSDVTPAEVICQLKETATNGVSSAKYEYDADGYLIRFYSAITGFSSLVPMDVTYNAQKQFTGIRFGDGSVYRVDAKYTGSTISSFEIYQLNVLLDKATITYNAQGLISQLSYVSGDVAKFEYDANKNPTRILETYPSTKEEYETLYTKYDDKKSADRGYKGVPLTASFTPLSVNNPLAATAIYRSEGKEVGRADATYTYTYNDKNFPTSYSFTAQGKTTTSTFTYQNCQ